jgi:hypothetical protein
MTNWEIALEAMKTGKKIREKDWENESACIAFINGHWINLGDGTNAYPDFHPSDKWEFYKEPTKLVKWYCPKITWYKYKNSPEVIVDRFFYTNKNISNWFAEYNNYKALEWYEIEAPETWEECELKE